MTWFVKRRRAQHPDDYETWQQEGVGPTLNAFDNTGDSRATVIVFQPGQMIRLGGGVWENIVPTLRAEAKRGDNEPHMVIFTAQRVGEPPRIYDDTTPSLLSRMGTGGNNVPMIATNEPIGFDSNASGSFKVHADGQSPPVKIGSALGIPSPPAVATDTTVRRLTPLECERLMGWPDNHTLYRADGKTNSDSTRYKMCGNGVASPVAEWIARQLLPLLT
jgi:site-specific DNA-cytosine methylase